MAFVSQMVDLDEARKHREILARMKMLENKTLPLPATIVKIPQHIIPQKIENTKDSRHLPLYKHSQKGYGRGYYGKVKTKLNDVFILYNQGLGIRTIAKELHLSKNTVRKVIDQAPNIINLEQVKLKKKQLQSQRAKGNIIKAIRCSVSCGKRYGCPLEVALDKAIVTFERHIQTEPRVTILALVGEQSFTVDDILNRVYEIASQQYLKLNSKKISEY